MAIDTSMYSNMQAPDLVGGYEKGLKMRELLDQRAQKDAVKDAYQKSVTVGADGTTSINKGMLMKQLFQSDPQQALAADKELTASEHTQSQMAGEKLKQAWEQNQRVGQILQTVKDQPSYDAAVSQAIKMGLVKPGELPQQFNQGFIDRQLGQNMTQSERLAQQRADWEQNFKTSESARDQKNKERELALKSREAAAKPPTAEQSKVAGFSERVRSSEKVMEELSKSGFDGNDRRTWAEKHLLNEGRPVQLQQLEQSQRNFVNAVLRRESGAAISPEEFESAKTQYFPQAGDAPEVLEQKRMNRLDVLASLDAEAGPALAGVRASRQRLAQEMPSRVVMTPQNKNVSVGPSKANAAQAPKVFKTSDIDWKD